MSETNLADRVRGAIWDLGTHWIYDQDELRRLHPNGARGFEAPAADHPRPRRRVNRKAVHVHAP